MPQRIERTEVRRLTERASTTTLIEVLPEDAYEAIHLPGAINIPLPALDEAAMATIDRYSTVVLYCYDNE